MALFSGDIKADPTLTALLGQAASGPQNDINSVYSRIKGNYGADAKARGVRPGSYFNDRIGVSQNQAQAGLQSSLEQILGDTTYKNALGERDAAQNEALAREIGALNKPSTLEEVLGGLAGGAQIAGGIYGATRRGAGAPQNRGKNLVPDPSLYGYDPYTSGYGRSA